MTTKVFSFFATVILSAGMALSQPVVRLPFNKKISIDEGLSSYNVKKIIQDKYGFIWMATQGGLNRYDGKEFLMYNKSMDADHQLLASDVWDMEEDKSRNILWVVTSYGGLNGISLITGKVCLRVEAMISPEGFNHDWLRCVRILKTDLWIGTYDGLTIYNITKKSFEKFAPIPFKRLAGRSFCVDKVFIDRYKNVWVFIANYGIVIYSGDDKTIIDYISISGLKLKDQSTYKQFNSVTSLPDGDLLTGTNQGFRRITYNQAGIKSACVGLFKNSPYFGDKEIEASGIDSFHYVWFSTSERLMKADVSNQTIKEVKDARVTLQNDWFNYIYDIYFDRSNNIWLGTGKGVTYTKNTIPTFTPYYISQDQSIKIDHAYYIYPLNDTITYVCTETGLTKVNAVTNEMVNLDSEKRYYFITAHKDRNLLASSEDSFFVYAPTVNRFFNIAAFYPELASLSHISVNSITYAGDSLAIIGTETANGFYLWDYVRKSLKKLNTPGLAEASAAYIVNTTYKDTENRIWVLGDKLISLYDLKSKLVKAININDPVTKIPYNIFFDVCQAGRYFWIAAYGSGLIQIDKNYKIVKVYSVSDGLSNAGVYKLFPVHDSLIFVTTNYGLSVLNLHTRQFSNYFKEDGLNSNAFEENSGLYKNGKIYTGGLNGFTVIDPDYFITNTVPPQVSLNRVRIETASGFKDTSDVLLNSLTVPNDVLQATVSVSALNYSSPLRTTYAYQLSDLDSNWIHLGTQNFVSLIGLSPGKHTLLIKSANENNVWTNKPLSLMLNYLPKWYQTLLFKMLVVLTALGSLYFIYAYRISQLNKQQQIRKDISVDLHDEMSHFIQSAKFFTHLAKKESHKANYLDKIEDMLVQTNIAFRDIIWILEDKEDSVYQFVDRIKKFALPIANERMIHLECYIESGLNEKIFTKTEKRHLLMIVKESITNILKYADCKNIKFSIRQIENKIKILVEDDGKGFDVDIASDGLGLKNMVYRAGQIAYRVDIISKTGLGTRVTVVKN